LLGAGAVAVALALGAPAGPSPARADHPKTKATPFDFNKPQPARSRKSFQDLSDDEVRAFASAVGVMRARVPITGPLQWDNLAVTHAQHCTEDGPDMLQLHWSYLFLPWHRAFLFFLEGHLADVIDKVLKNVPVSADKFALLSRVTESDGAGACRQTRLFSRSPSRWPCKLSPSPGR
jgi:polyphenol oxidase